MFSSKIVTKCLFHPVVCCLLFAAVASASASTLRVPADFPTIQAAVNSAVSGTDTILVDPGVYTEAVQCGTKSVQLISSGGSSVTFIIPPAGQIAVSLGEGVNTSTISGFTISNATHGVHIASGLASCPACTPTITSN